MLPFEQMMIVTVPRPGSTTVQHVRNSNTGAWCKFTIPAQCWASCSAGDFLGGETGIVSRFNNGAVTDGGTTTTNGSAIETDIQTAWSYLGYRNRLKKMNFLRQSLSYVALPSVAVSLGTDFAGPNAPTNTAIQPIAGGEYVWDDATSSWNTATWGGAREQKHFLYKQSGLGYAFSQRATIAATTAQIEWGATTYHFEQGHFI